MDSNRQSLPLKSFRSIARVGGSGQSAGLERCAHTTEVDNSIGAVPRKCCGATEEKSVDSPERIGDGFLEEVACVMGFVRWEHRTEMQE